MAEEHTDQKRRVYPVSALSCYPPYPCRLVRSQRKTLAIEVRPGEEIIVRAPYKMPAQQIDQFILSKQGWIKKHWERAPLSQKDYTQEQETFLRAQAKALLPVMAERFGQLLGVSPSRIRITGARTRFGSCSAKGNICFSFRLMSYPQEAIEYVVLHELAHLIHLNHSPAFYALIAHHMPDYKERARLLKQVKAPVPQEHKGGPPCI
ncbi:MAG: M48 family metallopeptidase [Clostridiales bacterium]|nr:M48 family metallopeptidase [Clostridiales bacterium]